jgi:hypothetical protein
MPRASDLRAANRFEAFARMRLEGRNDLVYRNYDMQAKKYKKHTLGTYLSAAGQPPLPHLEVLIMLQHRFEQWGFGKRDLPWIETLLREYYSYQKILYKGETRWPHRVPAEIQRLYDENAASQS